MKRIIAIIITVSSSAYCFSQDIRIEEAVSVAEAFSYSITGEHHRAVKVIPQTSNDTICYYNILLDGNFICSVSSTSYAPPILSYSEKSNDFDMPDSEMPSAYIDLLKLYEKQIRAILSDTGRFYRYPEWIPLLNNNFGHDTINGFALLDSVDGNSIKWGQRGINGNLYACDKSYNHECPWAPFISCNKALAGCGPVAMAQLMRYWKWPKRSEYREYHWEQMPCKIVYSTESSQALEIAQLIRDCGKSTNSIYSYFATGTLMDEIISSFQNDFGYQSVNKYRKSTWEYGNSWADLIESELDNSRPVIIYGDHGFPDNGHYFIVDGYKKTCNQTYYHINWGHRGNNNTFCLINSFIEPYSSGPESYTWNNHIIVGISPTYCESNIDHLNYRNVASNSNRTEYAYNIVSIPSIGETLTVENNAQYTIEAGLEIELLPGFEAQYGSEVDIRINPAWQSHMAISVPYWPNVNGRDGYCIRPANADSWEFTACDLAGNVVFQSAGSIRSDLVCMWDCTNALPGTYFCVVTLKNSFGRKLTNQHSFTVIQHGRNTPDESDESYSILQEEAMYSINPSIDNIDTTLTIYPNPSKDVFNIHISSGTIENITVYDNQSHTIYVDNNINSQEYLLNLQNHPRGLYTVNILSGNKYYSSSVLKQ